MQFLYPNVLFLLVVLGILIFLLSTNKNNMERFFDSNILDKLFVNNNSIGKTTRNIIFFLTLISFVIALARPVMDMKEQNIKQKLIPIVIALDVSKSMWATDIYPSRLLLAKEKLKHIVEFSKDTTIGIILFAKDSYILSPVTEDFTSLRYIIDNLDTNLNFPNGSNILAVLDATKQMLEDYKVKNLIILSDGGNSNEYTKELEFAQENDIVIYTVGLATKQGAPIPTKDGYLTDNKNNIVTVSLNLSIKNLALKSGGGYINYSLASSDVEAILNKIKKESKKEELSTKKITTYEELFYYPLAFGIFTLLIAFSSLPRRKQQSLVLGMIVCLSFSPTSTNANMLDFKSIQKAKQNYQDKDYENAIVEYGKVKQSNESKYNLANSYYKNKQYKKAIETYDNITTENKDLEYKKLHNLGNSYVQEKNLEKAKDFYEKALEIKDDKSTQENLDAVKEAIKKQKKKKKENKDQKDNKDKKEQDKKENKEEDKNKKSKENEEKNKDKKEQEKKKKEEQDKKKEQNSKDGEKKEEKEDEKASKSKESKASQEDITDMEEKKWLKVIQDKKAPIMLQKVQSREETDTTIQPW